MTTLKWLCPICDMNFNAAPASHILCAGCRVSMEKKYDEFYNSLPEPIQSHVSEAVSLVTAFVKERRENP